MYLSQFDYASLVHKEKVEQLLAQEVLRQAVTETRPALFGRLGTRFERLRKWFEVAGRQPRSSRSTCTC